MNKIPIEVPDYVDYISNWKEYTIPWGHCIIDKGITGCGFTEYCLTNPDNIILCSPRKLLLENKVEQHPGDPNILYLKNDNEKVIEYDCYIIERKKVPDDQVAENYGSQVNPFLQQIHTHSVNCQTTGKPVKFLVTYDSFHYLYEVLGEEIRNYKIVVDEFQSLFTDSAFKADTESELLDYLQQCPNVCYLSATPALDMYLESLDEFNQLDMYVFQWPSQLVEKVKIDMRKVGSIYGEGKKIIEQYLSGIYPTVITEDRQVFESHELVIYLNSVVDIIKLIKSCGLTTSNTDIICADTDYNRKRLRKIKFPISKPNTKENRHLNKMFTFCTRTVYLGADFYSDNASSLVLSNPNKQHLAIDVATDLAQIVGRQRMRENIFRRTCFFYYQTSNSVKTLEEFNAIISDKMKTSERIINSYNCIPDDSRLDWNDKLKDSALFRHYAKDYVGVSHRTNLPGINKFVLLSESRFWEITQKDYLDTINVRRNEIKNLDINFQNLQDKEKKELSEYLGVLNGPGDFRDKMKLYCTIRDLYSGKSDFLKTLNSEITDQKYQNYYNYFGSLKLKSISYQESEILKLYNDSRLDLSQEIYSLFEEGKSYTRKEIKAILSILYQGKGYNKTPKANDLEQYFDMKRSGISINGKQQEGFKIISKKV